MKKANPLQSGRLFIIIILAYFAKKTLGIRGNIVELTQIREQLDIVDQEIIRLYEQRMDLCRQVAAFKKENDRRVYDRSREEEKKASVRRMVKDEAYAKGAEELFSQLMSMSRKLQYTELAAGRAGKLPFIPVEELDRRARVVFQGAEGSYSEAATYRFFGEEANAFHVDTFRDAMVSLDEGSAEFAVLPIENSTAGIVSEIYDLLAEFEHFIVAEQMIRIEHCLMGCEGTDLKTIRTVFSHPQSLMQSEHYLRLHPE